MKIQTRSELIVAATLGCLTGLARTAAHLKWQKAGLAAFLDHQTQLYQKLYTRPVAAGWNIALWLFLMLIWYAVFKTVSIGLTWILSKFTAKDASERPDALAG